MLILCAFATVVFTWWISTGALLIAARRLRPDGNAIRLVLSLTAVATILSALWSARSDTTAGAYVGFLSGLSIWAGHELTFLTGMITGPRTTVASVSKSETLRFRQAFQVVRDHQIAILITAAAIFSIVHDAPNRMVLWTFMALWGMRLVAQFNLFLGAPYAATGFLPSRLHYVASYFRTDRISPAFPLSINVLAPIFVTVADHALYGTSEAGTAGSALLAGLIFLGLVELMFLVLPFGETALWKWAISETADQTRPAVDEASGERARRWKPRTRRLRGRKKSGG